MNSSEKLISIAKALTSTFDSGEVLSKSTQAVSEMLPLSDGAIIYLFDAADGMLHPVTEFAYGAEWVDYPMVEGEGAPGIVFLQGQARHFSGKEDAAELYASMRPEGRKLLDHASIVRPRSLQSVICAPLVARSRIIGALQVEHWRDESQFEQSDLQLLQSLADIIAIAIDNRHLLTELNRRTPEKSQAHQRADAPTIGQRELEVLDLLSKGYSNKQIATLLALSEHTVHAHRANLMRKLGAVNSAQLIAHAYDMGLLPTELI